MHCNVSSHCTVFVTRNFDCPVCIYLLLSNIPIRSISFLTDVSDRLLNASSSPPLPSNLCIVARLIPPAQHLPPRVYSLSNNRLLQHTHTHIQSVYSNILIYSTTTVQPNIVREIAMGNKGNYVFRP